MYEASGTIAINKPDTSLNLQNPATFSLDYYDPSELETEVKKLQSDRLALEVIRASEPGPAPGVWRTSVVLSFIGPRPRPSASRFRAGLVRPRRLQG